MTNKEISWVFIFSFSNGLSEQEYLCAVKDEMVTLLHHRKVLRAEVPVTLRVNYVYNGISPEDALKYMYRLSTRPDDAPLLPVKIYNINGSPYV